MFIERGQTDFGIRKQKLGRANWEWSNIFFLLTQAHGVITLQRERKVANWVYSKNEKLYPQQGK